MSYERVIESIRAIVEGTTETKAVVTGERTVRAELSNVPTSTLQKLMTEHGEDITLLTVQAGERHTEPYLIVRVGGRPDKKEKVV